MGIIEEINPSKGFIKYEKGNSDELIIIFSHIGFPAGKFAMSRAMKGLSASKLYINCNENSWYQIGIPGYSKDIVDTIDLLNRIISEINPNKTIACGISMGGYAALLFGIALKLDYVLAFTAEINIGHPHQRSFYLNKVKSYDPNYKDISNIITQNKDTSIHLVYGAYDIYDLHGIHSIKQAIRNPKFNLYLASGDHKVAELFDIPLQVQEILENGRLHINDLIFKKNIEEEDLRHYKNLLDKENDKIFQCQSFHKKEHKFCQDYFFYGKACLDLKRYDEALESFEKVISIDPNFPMGYHHAGLTLKALHLNKEAEKMYKKGLLIDPKLVGSYYRLGEVQMNLNNYIEAEKNLKKSLEPNPNNPFLADAWFLLGKLYEIKMIQCIEKSIELAPKQMKYKDKLESVNPSLKEDKSSQNSFLSLIKFFKNKK